MRIKHAWIGLGLLVFAGCYAPVRPDVDALVCASAEHPVDTQAHIVLPASATSQARKTSAGGAILQANFEEAEQDRPFGSTRRLNSLERRLQVPGDIPGSETPRIALSFKDIKNLTPEQVAKAVSPYFPPPTDIGAEPTLLAVPGPGGQPLTLAELQKLARANSPLLRQAASDVKAAEGTMIQMGLYYNPTIGLEGNTGGPSGGPTFGPFISQTIAVGGKFKLAQAAAAMDYENTKLAYRRAETDLTASVRTYYFAVLVAQENIRENRALVSLTDEVYRVMVNQLKGGEFATYEPMQVGVFAAQARQALIQARNSYVLAWRQLAAALGTPAMPPTMLADDIRQMPLPRWRYDAALEHVLTSHTDVATADNAILKARYNLRLAEVTIYPDITVQASVTNDETPPGPNRITAGMQISGALPVWNTNRGAVQAAKGALLRAIEEPHRVRDDLTGRVADAYRRYLENHQLMELYHKEILPKQVQAFRSTVQRHYGGEAGGVGYNDLVAAEQNLVTVIGNYITVLQNQWLAVSDLGSLLQSDDLFQVADGARLADMPDLTHLLELPCCHPCDPLANPALKGAHLEWPPTTIVPAEQGRETPPATAPTAPAGHGETTLGPALLAPMPAYLPNTKIGG